MEIIFEVTVYLAAVYLLISLLLQAGLSKNWPRGKFQPVVSVLIAARNEAASLPACLDHLAVQDYPSEKIQVLILNDRSTDDTADIARSYTARYQFMDYFEIDHDEPGLRGKMNVIAQGISRARGEIILITDADCFPSETWISGMVGYFTPDTGMVGGLTHIDGNSIFARIQACDWFFLQAVAAGSAGLGNPVSILGNNFGFRRSTYEQTGGYEQLPFSLTEDMALLQAIRRKTAMRITYPLDPKTLVRSRAAATPSALMHQRLRWIAGGRRTDSAGWIMLLTTFLLHLLLPVSLIFGPASSLLWQVIAVILIVDFLLLMRITLRVRKPRFLLLFPLFEIYFFIYTTVFGILSLFPVGVRWKGRIYRG
jgi:cellulose synthase/poly-beta-1,6-N-acetylglucosamine synthase-like glycosyltransferase